VTISIQPTYVLSTVFSGTLTGSDGSTVTFTGADLIRLSFGLGGIYHFEKAFDGADVGLTTPDENIDAFTFLGSGDLVVSTSGAFSVPGLGGVTITGSGEDLLIFHATSMGENTSGWWDIYFDGSDVGLTGRNVNVDAVAALPDGRLVLSTSDTVTLLGGTADVDLLAFTPTSLGANTAGSWAPYFDGSDVGLADSTGEDVDALIVRPAAFPGAMPTLYFSTLGKFNVPGLTGSDEDLFSFEPSALGPDTAGSYGPGLALDGSLYGLAAFGLDGIAAEGFTSRGGGGGGHSYSGPGDGGDGETLLLAPASPGFPAGPAGPLVADGGAEGGTIRTASTLSAGAVQEVAPTASAVVPLHGALLRQLAEPAPAPAPASPSRPEQPAAPATPVLDRLFASLPSRATRRGPDHLSLLPDDLLPPW
jgi:hypothetical protein